MSLHTNNDTNRKRQFGWIILGAIIILGGLYILQNRNTAQLTIRPTGQAAQVYINQSSQEPLSASSTTTYTVPAETVEVLVSANNTYPWQRQVTVSSENPPSVSPFLITRQPRVLRDPPKAVVGQLTKASISPPKSATSSSSQARLIANDNGQLIAEWTAGSSSAPNYYNCQTQSGRCGVVVYEQTEETVEQVAFYPGRNDVAIFATATGVYAIDINPNNDTQNFQPIIDNANDPHFFIADNVIFVRANDRVTATQL